MSRHPINDCNFEEELKIYLSSKPFAYDNYEIIKIDMPKLYAIVRAFSSLNEEMKEEKFFIYKVANTFFSKTYDGSIDLP